MLKRGMTQFPNGCAVVASILWIVLLSQPLGVARGERDSLKGSPDANFGQAQGQDASQEEIAKLREDLEEIKAKVEQEPKDIWDKIDAASGLISGILVAIIGVIATHVFNERLKNAESARNERALDVQRVQAVQSLLPSLSKEDEREKEAALVSIHALGNTKLATDLAKLYSAEGGIKALSRIASSGDSEAARIAQRSLDDIYATLRTSVVILSPKISSVGSRKGCGFIVHKSGLVVTTDRVVKEDLNLEVQLATKETYQAKMVKKKADAGLALLKVEGPLEEQEESTKFPALEFDESRQAQGAGQEVVVLGYGGDLSYIKTGVGRIVGTEGPPISKLPNLEVTTFKIDIRMAPGVEGSPVVDRGGMVVGIVYSVDYMDGSRMIPSWPIHEMLEHPSMDKS